MSTIVYQGLQSCYESQVIETTTLKLKVPTPSSSIEFGRKSYTCASTTTTHQHQHNIENIKEKCHSPNNYQQNQEVTNKNLDLGGWSCLQTLSNISLNEGTTTYVHPLSKRYSSSRLSEKSLELCTESLGSESGSDLTDSSIFSSFSSTYEKSSSPSSSVISDEQKNISSSSITTTTAKYISSINNCREFPPPLTTMRGRLNSIQFKPHREDGRLIIKAVETPLTHNYLQAERSNGRLRLCFFKHANSIFEENELSSCHENEEFENDMFEEEEEIEEKEEGEEKEEEKEESDNRYLKRDIDGNRFDVEGEMGIEKCQRLRSRCKESGQGGNKGFCDWRKPLWVATS